MFGLASMVFEIGMSCYHLNIGAVIFKKLISGFSWKKSENLVLCVHIQAW